MHPRMARARGGRWCGGLCGARSKEKADRDLESVVGARARGRGEGEGGASAGFAASVLVIVCVQLVVNYLAMRWVFGGRAGGDRLPSSLYSRSSRPTASSASSSLFTHLPAAPANAFEGSYFPPGVFSAQRDSLGSPPAAQATERYSRIDFTPRGLREVATSSSKSLLRWKPKGIPSKSSAQRSKTMVDFPPAAVNANAFAAAFKGRFFFEAGQHRFVIAASGGFRLFVDSVLVIDELSLGSTSMREPYVGTRLVSIPTAGLHEIWLEFEQSPAVTSHEHWKRFVASSSQPLRPPNWKQVAETMLGAHLHLHWIPDSLGLKVYMYDLPARFNDDVRASNEKCKKGHMFGSEVAIHLALAESSARTLDPREADLFYVPVYTACQYLGAPYFGVDPWFGKRMTKEAIKYAKQEFPFWRRNNGADHVFAMTYDYGACFEYKYSKANAAGVLRELNNAILLSIISDASVSCFRPAIDVPIPTYIAPTNSLLAPLPPLDSANRAKRDWFAYFQGQKEWEIDHDPEYSNGIRKLLFTQYAEDPLFHLGEGKTPQYVQNLRRSVFCLCPRGFAVWSPRPYESIVSGCIPVIIADNMHLPFFFEGSGVDWRDFSVMVPESRVRAGGSSGTQLKDILLAIPPDAIHAKQQALRRVRDKMVFLPPQQSRMNGESLIDRRSVSPRGDAFEMVLLALREKARAAKWVRSTVGSGFWT